MAKVWVQCDRCKEIVEGRRLTGGGTSGFYDMRQMPWAKYRRMEEDILCDACMHKDPGYQADYAGIPREPQEGL